mgnify:CR=1 FL=1
MPYTDYDSRMLAALEAATGQTDAGVGPFMDYDERILALLTFLAANSNTVVRPETFYVAADGTDDYPSIQAAIDFLEAESNAGGIVVLGRATYSLSATLVITKPGITIQGQGAGNRANLLPADEAPTKVIVAQNTGIGIHVRGQECKLLDFRLTRTRPIGKCDNRRIALRASE